MQNFLFTRLLKYAGGKLEGKKTYVGAIGKILLGVLVAIAIIFPDLGEQFGLPRMDPETVIGLFVAAYAALSGVQGAGIRSALNVQTKEIVNATSAPCPPDGPGSASPPGDFAGG